MCSSHSPQKNKYTITNTILAQPVWIKISREIWYDLIKNDKGLREEWRETGRRGGASGGKRGWPAVGSRELRVACSLRAENLTERRVIFRTDDMAPAEGWAEGCACAGGFVAILARGIMYNYARFMYIYTFWRDAAQAAGVAWELGFPPPIWKLCHNWLLTYYYSITV